MSDRAYVYGDTNGACFDSQWEDKETGGRQVYWDSRIEVSGIAHTVQVGIVPPSETSTDDAGVWKTEDGLFLHLNRDGVNRLIEALQEAGAATFGRDRW